VAQHHDLFKRFTDSANKALQAILRELDLGLGRFPSHSLQSYHSIEQPSLSTLAMFRYPMQDSLNVGVGHNKHTDLGTLTFLLCQSPGLQVLSNNPAGWQYVAPKAQCAIINVGDTLRFLSGNSLRSAVHRVMPVDKLQLDHRYSIAYFLRAENSTEFTDSSGRSVSAKAWHDEKFDVFRESHAEQAKRAILTGGMEQNGALLY
jgi:isopenicillin N synthase-like dioxygenase